MTSTLSIFEGILEPCQTNSTDLTDLSPTDKPWDTHRAHADTLSDLLEGYQPDRYYQGQLVKPPSRKVASCANFLEMGWASVEDSPGEVRLALQKAQFCRCRLCPICQWRRSMKWQARLFTAIPKMLADHPTIRFLFLTLTIKNCPIEDLKDQISLLNKGWDRLAKLKAFPALGAIRTLEVTRNPQTGEAHPHIHALLAVPAGYFSGRNYVKQDRWVTLWKQSLRIDYDPVVDVRSVYSRVGSTNQEALLEAVKAAIIETVKYGTKPSDYLEDRDWLIQLEQALYKMKMVSVSGLFRTYLREEEVEADLIHIEEDNEADSASDLDPIHFAWRKDRQRYSLCNPLPIEPDTESDTDLDTESE